MACECGQVDIPLLSIKQPNQEGLVGHNLLQVIAA